MSTDYASKRGSGILKYLLAGVAGAIVFGIAYGLQYLVWFSPGELLVSSLQSVAESSYAQQKHNAVEAQNSLALRLALADHLARKKEHYFTAYFTSGTERVFAQLLASEQSQLSSAQGEAYDAFIQFYPLNREKMTRVAFDEYVDSREQFVEMFAKMPEERRNDFFFNIDNTMPEITLEDFDAFGTETWIFLYPQRDNDPITIEVIFRIGSKKPAQSNIYVRDGEILTESELYNFEEE